MKRKELYSEKFAFFKTRQKSLPFFHDKTKKFAFFKTRHKSLPFLTVKCKENSTLPKMDSVENKVIISFHRKRFSKATCEFLCNKMDDETDAAHSINLKNLSNCSANKMDTLWALKAI